MTNDIVNYIIKMFDDIKHLDNMGKNIRNFIKKQGGTLPKKFTNT